MQRTLNSYARTPYHGLRPVERNIAGHLPAAPASKPHPGHKVVGVLAAAAAASVLTGVGISSAGTSSTSTPALDATAPTTPSLTLPLGAAASAATTAVSPGSGSLTLSALEQAAAQPASYVLASSQTAAISSVAAAAPATANLKTVSGTTSVAARTAHASDVTTHDRHAVTAMRTSLSRLRSCESGGNYHVASGNGYYGAYQFDLSTWRSLGLSGLPNHASRQLQDVAVTRLQARKGWGPWPVCSYVAGLR